MRIISFIDQADVIKKILQHLGLWEDCQAPSESAPPREEIKELNFDPSYNQLIFRVPYPYPELVMSITAHPSHSTLT